jgi:hypothetical protein
MSASGRDRSWEGERDARLREIGTAALVEQRRDARMLGATLTSGRIFT